MVGGLGTVTPATDPAREYWLRDDLELDGCAVSWPRTSRRRGSCFGKGVRTVLLDLEGLAASEIAQAAPSGP
jgi:hypothetical protein